MLDHATITSPQSDYDPYDEAALLSPFDGYDMLREMGPAVWLTKHRMFALTRYDAVKRVLTDPETFISGHGIMMNEMLNASLRGATLTSDGDHHRMLRAVRRFSSAT